MKLTRKDLALTPTRHGLVFLIILGAMLAGSVNYNNNAGFVLVFLLGGMALISLFHSFQNLMGLEAGFISAPPVFAGQAAGFRIRLRAGGRERASLLLKLAGGDETSATLGREEEKSIEATSTAKKRGMFHPGVLDIASVYPFGLFRIRARVPVDMGCLVYPAPIDGEFRMARGGSGMDGSVDTRDTGPDDFQGLALYQPGHDIGRIAWKAVSRGQGIFVKDFTARADQFRMLDFDAFSGTDTEFRLSRLCSLILEAHSRHMQFGLSLPGARIDPGSGNAHKKQCLRAIALFGTGPGDKP